MTHSRLSTLCLCILVHLLLAGPALYGHDLQTQLRLEASFVVLEASYEGEEPASYLAVRVMAPEPGEGADAFQTGRTDRKGHFVFLPDRPGLWRVTVDDEMGHRVTSEVSVTAPDGPPGTASAVPPAAPGPVTRSTGDKLLVGLSLLFGAAGLLFAWTSRKRGAQAV